MLSNREIYGLIFLLFINFVIAFGYAKNKAGLVDSTATILKNTFINLIIIVITELIIFGVIIVITGANPFNVALFGGDLISGALSFIGKLLSSLV